MVVLSAGTCCQRCFLWHNTGGHELVASCAVVGGLLELSNNLIPVCVAGMGSGSEASCSSYCGSTAAIGPYWTIHTCSKKSTTLTLTQSLPRLQGDAPVNGASEQHGSQRSRAALCPTGVRSGLRCCRAYAGRHTKDLQRQGVLLAIASSTVPWEQAVLKPFQPWAEVQPRASSAET